MATGTISSLGVGSGLELQSILDQLREVDEQVVTTKEAEVTVLESQLNEFTVVNNKLLAMKSSALDLSLSSTFLSRTVSSTDEDVFTATVSDGTSVQATSVTVDRIATKSTWLSGGAASSDVIVYVPTSQESTTGVANQTDVVAAAGGDLVITYGASDTITVTAPAGTKLEDAADQPNSLVHLINSDAENGGKVTASSFQLDGEWYLRIETTNGTGEDYRVGITTNDTDLTLSPPDKTFAYQVGSDTATVSVAADSTMSQLVDLINNDTDNPGATASIIDTGEATNPYKLVLQADTTGQDNEISILAQLPDISLTVQSVTGANLNAQVTIDGISYQRQTNSINDIITGITFSLKDAGTATVSVANNDESITTLITDLVTAYNDAVQEVQTNVNYDEETEEFGLLARTTVRDLPYDLQNLMTTTVKADTNGNVTTLFDLGLEFNRDGTISIDSTVLASAISSYSSGVEDFFLGDDDEGITGFADLVNDYLREVTGGSGQIAAEKNAGQLRIDDLELQIETETERLDKKYDLLAKQFIELDRYMNQMTSISNYLTSQFDSLSNLLSGGGSS